MCRPCFPMIQPATDVGATNLAWVRGLPPLGGCPRGWRPPNGSTGVAPGLYLKSLGCRRPRSARSCRIALIFETAETTWPPVPVMPIGWSFMPMIFSLPTLTSAPDNSITSLICAPFCPITAGAEEDGTIMTKTPGSWSTTSCRPRSLSTMRLQDASFCSTEPLMVQILSLRDAGVSPSPEMSTAAPVWSQISLRPALLGPATTGTASTGSRARHGTGKFMCAELWCGPPP
mmetsp:Transcript_97556/g.275973  ORF Transcript_97556/g.275973 Transcript_97556/m.275973 type:complete len:231 (-) Transcript_97556:38-730(-)